MAFNDFGEKFAAKVLRRFYQDAVTPAITNSNYEGEIKQAGDRVNILSFPGDMQLADYTAHTDMSLYEVYDMEDQLVVEKRKYTNFEIDKLEDLFTYVDDGAEALVESSAKSIEREIDKYVLEQAALAKAGSWVGIDVRIVGSSRDTEASIATTATGGTLTVQGSPTLGGQVGAIEHGDGSMDYFGFETGDIGKPVRLTSGTSWATAWYRISGITNSQTATIENWDGATEAMDIPNGDVLRGMYGGFQFTGGAINGDGKPTTEGGWGWEFQAARATALTATNIYEVLTLLAEKLDSNEVPDTDRHVTVTPEVVTLLRQAAELQPAISMAYENVILNGKVGRCAGFDIHVAAGSRVSSRVDHSTSTLNGADTVLITGSRAYQILGNHRSFCTFAYKWSENRVKEAEDRFAKKYQALHLYGAKVANIRRRSGAVVLGTI